MLAVIELSFDPFLRVGDLAVRWQTVELTFALLAAIAVATLTAPRRRFFRDRMTLIIAGIAPGAAVGGRVVHVLVYWDAYAADPTRMFNPFVGSLSLTGAVLGGTITAIFLAKIVGAPVGRWADAAAVPLLIALGFGKLAQLLGGSGQGLPFDGDWAVAFLGNGSWISADPALPSHPSQVYEGLWLLAGIPIVLAWFDRRWGLGDVTRTGGLLVGALVWFLLGRIAVGFTWRDERLIGPVNGEQVIAAVALVAVLVIASRRPAPSPVEPPEYRFGERRKKGA
jgi:phosphatidylglycerol:prolipoprotein diacylglycerol transferase